LPNPVMPTKNFILGKNIKEKKAIKAGFGLKL
jgi:hypothetical protein